MHTAYGQNRGVLIVVINIIIIVGLLIYIIKNFSNLSKVVNVSLLLVLAGGIGNLIDRLFRGYVIDYIDINNLFEFPVFNLADIFVVVGVAIIIICILLDGKRKQEKVE